jgi:hypothetical protein
MFSNFWVCKEDCLSTFLKQFCDVTNVVIINKQVLPILVINDIWKEKNIFKVIWQQKNPPEIIFTNL